MMAAETYIHKPRIAKDCGQHQKQETPGTDSPLEPSERAGRALPHRDFRLPVPRTLRGFISTVLGHPVCGHWLWQPRKLTQDLQINQSEDNRPSWIRCLTPGRKQGPGGGFRGTGF